MNRGQCLSTQEGKGEEEGKGRRKGRGGGRREGGGVRSGYLATHKMVGRATCVATHAPVP